MTSRGLELAWKRVDGTTYDRLLPESEQVEAYMVSEGLDPKAFFRVVGH